LKTPPPILDVVRDFPELAPMARTSVRLHPRRVADGPIDASKLGGDFLWPVDEPWPAYDEAGVDRFVQDLLGQGGIDDGGRIPERTSIPFAPILQLRAADFPEMTFPDEADLFQLLWFPYLVAITQAVRCPDSSIDHRVYWRNSGTLGACRTSNPEMVERHLGTFAQPSCLSPERVVEYPNSQDLDPKLERRIDRWRAVKRVEHEGDSPIDFYNWECSTCPSTKVGGYVFWVQDKKVPTCECGQAMTHLLTVAESEWDGGTFRRWQPIEDQEEGADTDWDDIRSPFDLGNFGNFYLFACLHCDGFPTRAVTAR
jgi:hypothetical protein